MPVGDAHAHTHALVPGPLALNVLLCADVLLRNALPVPLELGGGAVAVKLCFAALKSNKYRFNSSHFTMDRIHSNISSCPQNLFFCLLKFPCPQIVSSYVPMVTNH